MSKVREKQTDQVLQAASEHLLYEISMLRWTTDALAVTNLGRPTPPLVYMNALLESFCLHARNLLDFLYPKQPRPDDMIAPDFFDDPDEWSPPDLTPLLGTVRGRAGKELAHLTYQRLAVTKEGKSWQYGKILAELSDVLGKFMISVPPDRFDDDFKREVRNLLVGYQWP